MPVCIVMVGVPASGKSTRVRDMGIMDPDVFVYSTDNLIEAWAENNGWSYDFAFSKYIDKATRQMNELVDIAIKNRMNIIWDQTNLGVGKRRKIINRMKQAGYTVECECIMVPMGDSQTEDWQFRLKSRPGKIIPDNILYNMMDSFVKPEVDEGFDRVYTYDMYGNLLDEYYVET